MRPPPTGAVKASTPSGPTTAARVADVAEVAEAEAEAETEGRPGPEPASDGGTPGPT